MSERGVLPSDVAAAFAGPHSDVPALNGARKLLGQARGRRLGVVYAVKESGDIVIITAYWSD